MYIEKGVWAIIENCTFEGNSANQGSAMYLLGGPNLVRHTNFLGNGGLGVCMLSLECL